MAGRTKAPPSREVTKRRLARWQQERRRRRITVIIGAVVVAAVIGIIVYGIYTTVVAPPRQLLSTVNGTSITAADYSEALRLYPYLGSPEAPLFMLENNELVRQGAVELNIEVTQDEVTEEIRDSLSTEGEALTAEEFQQRYQELLNSLQLSDSKFREIVETELLGGKLDQHLVDQVPEVGEVLTQVHVQAILVTNETAAQVVMDRLDAGEDFASLAEEYGDGDPGWIPQGIMRLSFDRVAFGLDPGTVSEPFSLDGGYYIIKVIEKGQKALDEETREQLEANAFPRWLEVQREEKVERNPDLDIEAIYEWALEQIG